jgi:hypothetical protein
MIGGIKMSPATMSQMTMLSSFMLYTSLVLGPIARPRLVD